MIHGFVNEALMIIQVILFWGVLILGIVALVRWLRLGEGGRRVDAEDSAVVSKGPSSSRIAGPVSIAPLSIPHIL